MLNYYIFLICPFALLQASLFDKDSADITDEDQTKAYKAAEKQMEDNASNDTVLLSEAQQRAQSMLEDYVNNLGKTFGKQYTINWKYIEDEEE